MLSQQFIPNAHLSSQEKAERLNRPADSAIKMGNLAKALLLRVFLFPGCRVVEFGCGPGSNILKLEIAQPSALVFVDICATSIAETIRRIECRRNEPTYLKNYRTAVLDFTQLFSEETKLLYFSDAPYNFVLSLYSLQYSGRSGAALSDFFENCSSLLGPGGIFIGIMPNAQRLRQAVNSGENVLFRVKVNNENRAIFFSGQSGVPYEFNISGKVYHEYTLAPADLVAVSSRKKFCVQFVLSMADFVSRYSNFYKKLASSLRTFMLPKRGNDFGNQDFELFNLYDVVVLQRG